MTPEVLEKAQALLDQDIAVTEIAQQLEIKRNTLSKAISDKRLHKVEKKKKIRP